MYMYIQGKKVGINQLFPYSWKRIGKKQKIAFTAFKLKVPEKEIFSTSPTVIGCKDSIIAIFHGQLEYQDRVVATLYHEGSAIVTPNIKTEESTIMICFFKSDNLQKDAHELENEANNLAVMASLKMGNALILNKIITHTFDFEQKTPIHFTVATPIDIHLLDFELMGIFPTKFKYKPITSIIQLVENHPKRNRIISSSNWYLQSLNLKGVDSFLAKWIALEALCMKNTSNIAPIKDTLAAAYNTSFNKISNEFAIGKAYGLRNKIVHNGQRLQLNPNFLLFMNHIIEDCLCQTLGLPTKHQARKYIKKKSFNPKKYLENLMKKLKKSNF